MGSNDFDYEDRFSDLLRCGVEIIQIFLFYDNGTYVWQMSSRTEGGKTSPTTRWETRFHCIN